MPTHIPRPPNLHFMSGTTLLLGPTTNLTNASVENDLPLTMQRRNGLAMFKGSVKAIIVFVPKIYSLCASDWSCDTSTDNSDSEALSNSAPLSSFASGAKALAMSS